MDNKILLAYKNRLINAGLPYALVRKNLRELQDHYHDLQQLALAKGLDQSAVKAAASQQLGDPEPLAAAMIQRPELRSKLHRFPVSITVIGLVLLCLLGSSLIVHLSWPDPAIAQSGMVGVSYGVGQGRPYEQVLTYLLRLAINLLLCGGFAWHCRRKEHSATISGGLL